MSKLPRCTARQLARALERAGFALRRQTGSHAIYRDDHGHVVNVPMHAGDLATGTIDALRKAAGLSSDELRNLL